MEHNGGIDENHGRLGLLIMGLLVSLKRTDAVQCAWTSWCHAFPEPRHDVLHQSGYDEAPLALLMALSVAGYGLNLVDSRAQLRIHSLLMATSLLLVMGWKGFELTTCFGVWLTVLLVAEGWMALLAKADGERLSWLVHPWKMGALSSLLVVASVCLVGVGSSSGTFSVVSDRPLLFLVAVVLALFDALVLYLLVGCLLWPTVVRRWTALRNSWPGSDHADGVHQRCPHRCRALHRGPVDARILALGHRSGRNDGCAWKQRTVRHVALGSRLGSFEIGGAGTFAIDVRVDHDAHSRCTGSSVLALHDLCGAPSVVGGCR